MKRWGLVVTLVYVVIVVALLVPATMLLASKSIPSLSDFEEFCRSWGTWIVAGVFVLGQVVLLGVNVDTTRRRLPPRTPVIVSALTVGLFLMIITVVAGLVVFLVVWGEDKFPKLSDLTSVVAMIIVLWVAWGILFYLFYRNSTDPVTRAVSRLFRGSVLELLVAVPAHVIVRRRQDCCAPMITSFGITTGIAIMLMSFGPSVLWLLKKRMERYLVAK